jgi:NAD+ synthase (glutamine-hydrolysing)
MRIALAQTNSRLGDFQYNSNKIIEYIKRASEKRCQLVVFPEATIFGYHPMDLLERRSVVLEQLKYLKKINKVIPQNMGVIIGAFTLNPNRNGKPYYNSAVFLEKNKKPQVFHKELLPTYDVFDEARHIEKGRLEKNILHWNGKKILITICEDIWAFPKNSKSNSLYFENPIRRVRPGSVDLCVNLSASPYFIDKMEQRHFVTRSVVKHLKCPMIYANLVGAQDELIFDGGSFALNKKGKIIAQSIRFDEDLNVVDFATEIGGHRTLEKNKVECLRQALVLGIRDFINKLNIKTVHLGISGGVDSALVACLAVDALGADRVKGVALPGPYSTKLSLNLAKQLAKNLNIELMVFDIKKIYKSSVLEINKTFGTSDFGLMHENLQARIRGQVLMSYANKNSSLLLNTTNKSEMASGYGTLYGDLCGGLSPIGDLLKSDVYALTDLYNNEYEIIPKKIITRAPTAELRPNQKDSDSLPVYEKLDQAVIRLVEKMAAAKTKEEKFLLQALMRNEFKRWQSPPILKVREHSFGQGRRMPLAHKAIY